MRKVIVYIATSLDGYIADVNGGVGWLTGDGSESENVGSYPEFIKSVDTVILGHKTYHQIVTELSPEVWVYADMTSYVMTHKKLDDKQGIFFTDIDLKQLIKKLKSEGGKDIWICGGASLVNACVEQDLADEYTISIIPTILGGGTRLFGDHKIEKPLKLKSSVTYNGIVESTYVKRD